MELTIRDATMADAKALLALYAPYVRETAVSFELDPPSVREFQDRMAATLERYPYLVAELGGKVVGYAFAGEFHAREAYRSSAETSIYVARDMHGRGIGRALYEALERACVRCGITNLYACLAYVQPEDECLTLASPLFHGRMGYRLVGRFESCARKFGRWYDMVYMEKHIAPDA